jgi:hypothetical protein
MKTETFVNGEQAENMIKYTDNYVIRFDHRIEYECIEKDQTLEGGE